MPGHRKISRETTYELINVPTCCIFEVVVQEYKMHYDNKQHNNNMSPEEKYHLYSMVIKRSAGQRAMDFVPTQDEREMSTLWQEQVDFLPPIYFLKKQ